MRDGPLDSLDRARQTFTASLLDGIGKADAGADFFLAVVNAERHGYLLDAGDDALVKMFHAVIRKEDESQATGTQGAVSLEAEAEAGPMVSAGLAQSQVGYALSHGAGMGLADNPSYDEMRVVPPEPGQSLTGRKFEMVDGNAEDPYRTHDPLGSAQFNPLHDRYHEHVADFYNSGQSEHDSAREADWETHAREGDHRFMLNAHHYGELDTEYATNHALYEENYLKWSRGQGQEASSRIDDAVGRGELTVQQGEQAKRDAHMNQRKAEWSQDFGLMDYLMGLEWLTPEQRHDFYEHLREHGAADPNQPFRVPGIANGANLIPRFVRNFHQRFSGLYDHWVRPVGMPTEPVMNRPIRLPEKAEYVEKVHGLSAMMEHGKAGKEGSAWERAVKEYNLRLQEHAQLNGYQLRPQDLLTASETPHITKHTDGTVSVTHRPLFNQEKADGSVDSGTAPSYLVMAAMLGVDPETRKLLPAGAPHYLGLDSGMFHSRPDKVFTQDEIDEIFRRRDESAKQVSSASRMASNHGIFHFGTHVDPEHYGYANGDHTTLATFWKKPWMRGGMGKRPNELFNLLHHHTKLFEPEEVEGEADEEARMLAEFYGEEAAPQTTTQFNPVEARTGVAGLRGKQEDSLMFSRTGTGIMARHEDEGASMVPFIGPFGQREAQLFRMMQGKKVVNVQNVGDVTDAGSTMNPHNVSVSSRIKGSGGQNAHYNRHATTVDGAYHNTLAREYHDARESGDGRAATLAHNRRTGQESEHLTGQNPFGVAGGAYNEETFDKHHSQHHHAIATMMGFARAPMDPQQHVFHLTDDRGRLTSSLADHDAQMEELQHRDEPPAAADLERELAALDAEFEQRMRVAPEGRQQELEEEYARRKERLHSTHERRMYRFGEAPLDDDPDASVMVNYGVNFPAGSAPSGELEPRISETQPATEEHERYFMLAERVGALQNEMAQAQREGATRSQLQTYRDQMSELNEELARLETGLSEGGSRMSGALGDSTKKVGLKRNTLADRLRADDHAIGQAVRHIVDRMDPETRDHILNPNLPHETVEANMRMLARMGNEFLHAAPHGTHGIHTMGTTEHEVGQKRHADLGHEIKSLGHEHGEPFEFTSSEIAEHPESKPYQLPGDRSEKSLVDDMCAQLGIDPKNPIHRQTAFDYLTGVITPLLTRGEEARVSEMKHHAQPLLERLGLDPNSRHSQQVAIDYLAETALPRAIAGLPPAPVMSVRQLMEKLHPDRDIAAEAEKMRKQRAAMDVQLDVGRVHRTIGYQADERNQQLGMQFTQAYNADSRRSESEPLTKKPAGGGNQRERKYWNTKQHLDSLVTFLPEVEAASSVTETKRGRAPVPVDAVGPHGHSVHSLYNSSGLAHEYGDLFHPNFNFRIGFDGEVSIMPSAQGIPMRLVQPTETIWNAVAPAAWMHMLKHPDHAGARAALNTLERQAAHTKPTSTGLTRHQGSTNVVKSELGLADLTNPDILRKELGPKVPLLQPMHRIFKLEDLEHLRGFTGDWIVSHMPEGERGFVEKDDDDDITSTFSLSDEDKENFQKVTDHEYKVDVVKLEDSYYIFDVLEFAGKEVHDVPLNDRIKILRGGMEGIDNIHTPSASDTRLTDDEGLKLAVESLQKDHENILLRDAKSVYMAGEMRHPKWVMLRPGQDVVLRVLERRGAGPYTYRLGTGPITQEEAIGDRAVEAGGDTYMDVGAAFNSSEKFNEGDHVRVNVANVSRVENSVEDPVFTIMGSEIEGEAEGEPLVSRETLGLLAKSVGPQWLCEVERASTGVRVVMPQGDVLYKATESGGMWTLHSPLADNRYVIRLSESQRPYWGPVAGALLKANLEIKEEVHESEEEAEPLIEPKKVKGTSWWDDRQKAKVLVKGLELVDRLFKSSIGAVGAANAGAKGLGFDYATPIESPMGPTNLHDEKTMPDYDNRKRPGEDEDIEEESEDSEAPKRMSVPTEAGVLDITEDKAVLRR